jgi:hypothetical protein
VNFKVHIKFYYLKISQGFCVNIKTQWKIQFLIFKFEHLLHKFYWNIFHFLPIYGLGIVRNKAPPPQDHRRYNGRQRNGEFSQQGKIYFCRRVARHMGTASTKSRPEVCLFIPDAVGPCSPYSGWSSSGAQSADNWLMLYLEFGGRVHSNFSAKIQVGEQESGNTSS